MMGNKKFRVSFWMRSCEVVSKVSVSIDFQTCKESSHGKCPRNHLIKCERA